MAGMETRDGPGWDDFARSLVAETRQHAEPALKSVLLHLEGATKRTLTGRRTGRVYRVSRTGKLHQASAPGEPPAVLYGMLRNSVTHEGPTWRGDTLEGRVGTRAVPYARRLEYGGAHIQGGTVVQIAPRPFLRPTFAREETRVDQILKEWLP
jgi:hypothetical protein